MNPITRSLIFRFIILLFILLPVQTDICAREKSLDEHQKALEYIQSRGEVYLHIPYAGISQLNDLSAFLSVDHVSDGTVYVYANRKGLQELTNRHITYHVEIPPSLTRMVRMEK